MNALVSLLAVVLFVLCSSSGALRVRSKFHKNFAATVTITIIVDHSGKGNFTSVQQAINWVSSNNRRWIRIQVRPGTYNEKVTIPREKKFIYLEGNSRRNTVIQTAIDFSNGINSVFSVFADNFVASQITFKNTCNARRTQATALLLQGDKTSIYRCGMISVQDTLLDSVGRHYFSECYIEGSTDFIWGGGQSEYVNCQIFSRTLGVTPGYITAHGRVSATDPGGFVFKYCNVGGDGITYLGRAYKAFSRVIFYKSYLGSNVIPQGWDIWEQANHKNDITYVEDSCFGPGSDMSNRVGWMKKLDVKELSQFVNKLRFIDSEGWINAQPPGPQFQKFQAYS